MSQSPAFARLHPGVQPGHLDPRLAGTQADPERRHPGAPGRGSAAPAPLRPHRRGQDGGCVPAHHLAARGGARALGSDPLRRPAQGAHQRPVHQVGDTLRTPGHSRAPLARRRARQPQKGITRAARRHPAHHPGIVRIEFLELRPARPARLPRPRLRRHRRTALLPRQRARRSPPQPAGPARRRHRAHAPPARPVRHPSRPARRPCLPRPRRPGERARH